MFSKNYERFIHDNLKNYLDSFLSKFRPAIAENHIAQIMNS